MLDAITFADKLKICELHRYSPALKLTMHDGNLSTLVSLLRGVHTRQNSLDAINRLKTLRTSALFEQCIIINGLKLLAT